MIIGRNIENEENIELDLGKLISTRVLINANSGAGKSWLGRRMMEQCADKVQQIIIDFEGEFVSLREKYDFLLVGKGGEIPINIRTAELLAIKLLELKVSAVIDLSELKKHERHSFVKKFLESLMDSPEKLWTPLLVYVDEAHLFAPEGKSGKSESKESMIDLGTRGRKRGFCGVFMTQRISKLDKDLAAELNNQMIGRTTLDIDRKRAADNLGFTTKEQERRLRDLDDGVFYCFGPAFKHKGIIKMKVGRIETTHPDRTKGIIIKPTKTPENIQKLLKRLVDLPKEAEKELKTTQEFKSKIQELVKEIRVLEHSKPKPEADEKALERERMQGFKEAEIQAKNLISEQDKVLKKLGHKLFKINEIIGEGVSTLSLESIKVENPIKFKPHIKSPTPIPFTQVTPESNFVKEVKPMEYVGEGEINLGICAKKVYSVLYGNQGVEFSKTQLALLSGYSIKSSGFVNALSQLNVLGLTKKEGNKISINEINEEYAIEKTEGISREMWAKNLGLCPKKIFEFLLEHEMEEFSKEDIAEDVGYSINSSGFVNAISKLNSLNLIKKSHEGMIKLNPELLEI